MKTQFTNLKIGDRFHYNTDADGHEPYLYKVSDTEAYVEHGSGSGQRETIAPETDVWAWSEQVTLHNAPTEIERAAITILMSSRGHSPRADHVGLREYIRALAQNPNEMKSLDTYIWETTATLDDGREFRLQQLCQQTGYECWQKQYDRDHNAFGAILDHEPRGRKPATGEERRLALIDDAAARLSSAIADYRLAGRPAGDQTHTVSGMGTPLLNVTTSLAAAVAEYHERVVNIYISERLNLQDRDSKCT